MTVDELRLELECYRDTFNDNCNICNLSNEELAEFISYYVELKEYEKANKGLLKSIVKTIYLLISETLFSYLKKLLFYI